MSRGTPSMVALLGLLAVAGYKNRDKIQEFLGARQGAGGMLSGGIGELVERFKRNGQGQAADSWVGTGPNQPLAADQLEQAMGPDVFKSLSQHTGLSREELLSRLTRDLPGAVDKFTPQGRLPTEDEAARLL